jgi:hypothetical protein
MDTVWNLLILYLHRRTLQQDVENIRSISRGKEIQYKNTLQSNAAFIQFANTFLSNKMDVLQKDVDHCLVSPYAPFTAIIFCLSSIDLLGALYTGEAAPKLVRKRKATDQEQHVIQLDI